MSDSNGPALGYLAWHEMAEGGGFTGGLLVVSDEGFPQEFRCTEPIRPSTVQSILYGDSLRLYMFSTLIGKNLWDHVTLKPPMLLIDDADLWCVDGQLSAPVAHVTPLERDGELMEVADTAEAAESFIVTTPRGDRIGLRLRGTALETASECQTLMKRCAANMDVNEPFDRVRAVLEALERQRAKER